MHDLDILFFHAERNDFTHRAIFGVAAGDFGFADVNDVFVMDALENLGGDGSIDHSRSFFSHQEVFGTNHDVDFFV